LRYSPPAAAGVHLRSPNLQPSPANRSVKKTAVSPRRRCLLC
jgi:hypothetical protein